MSYNTQPRIKQIRKKSGENLISVPLGSQGQYVDMKSNLDLEQELLLGGNHSVEITYPNYGTHIEEIYYKHKIGTVKSFNYQNFVLQEEQEGIEAEYLVTSTGSQNYLSNIVYEYYGDEIENITYKIITDILEYEQQFIQIYAGNDNYVLGKSQTQSIINYIKGNGDQLINTVLYDRGENILHQKNIVISSDEEANKENITEGVLI